MRRKLTTIVAADMVNYSRLMSKDERAVILALEILRSHFLEPITQKYGGRIFRLLGDGIMLEFDSALGAVEFAMEMQRSLGAHNTANPQQIPLVLRMGINLGDAVIDNGDLHGESVTIAARIESLSEPGGICLTDAVHEQIKLRLAEQFVMIGSRSLKNIADPIQLWRWRPAPDSRNKALIPHKGSLTASGQYLLDARLLDLILRLHARSVFLSISDALDRAAGEDEGKIAIDALYRHVDEELGLVRQLLNVIKIESAVEESEPLSEDGGWRGLGDFAKALSRDSKMGYAFRIIPETQSILADDDPYYVKRVRVLDLIRSVHDEAYIQNTRRLIGHAYID